MRKETNKDDHEELCKAIVAHMDLARELKDYRLACAAVALTAELDKRRKTPWGGDFSKNGPTVFRHSLDEYRPRRPAQGTFGPTFEEGYSHLSYEVFCETEKDFTMSRPS